MNFKTTIKTYRPLFTYLLLIFVSIFVFSSFKRGTTILEGATYTQVFSESILSDVWQNNDGVLVDFRAFPNALALVIPQVSPRRWISNGNAPKLAIGGNFNVPDGNVVTGAVRGNEISSLSIYNNVDQDVVAETFRSIKSGSTHREFDINLNVNYKNPSALVYNEPTTSQYNIRTTLIHELCHGVGLEHVPASTSRLMQANTKGVYLLSITFDEQKAFNCFYANKDCQYEGDSGNLILSTEIIDNTFNGGSNNQKLSWLIETHDNNTIGFNIYKLNNEGNYETINSKMIEYSSDEDKYSYTVNDQSDYYLEIVTTDLLETKFINF